MVKACGKNKLVSTLEAPSYRVGALYCTGLNMTNAVSTNRNWVWKVKPYDSSAPSLPGLQMW